MPRKPEVRVIDYEAAADPKLFSRGPRYAFASLAELRLLLKDLQGKEVANGHPRLLRMRQVAQMLNVSTKTVRRMVMDGELPVIRRGGNSTNAAWLIEVAAVERWIEREAERL
jgi:excisionase family DNA binding protein